MKKNIRLSILISFLIFSIILAFSIKTFAADSYSTYLFIHFISEGTMGEQVYFSVSKDGLNWTELNNAAPVLISDIGENGVRDISLIRSSDGNKYFLLATDLRIANGYGWSVAMYEGSTNIVIWESNDLINWSEPRLVDVAGEIPDAGCAWAPEAIYDDTTGNYVVYWATISPLNNITKARIYYSTTNDFVTFSSPELYIDRADDQEIIDTQIIKVENSTYQYYRASRDGQITFEGSNSILGNWNTIGNISHLGLTGSDVEGPILFKFNNENKWCLMVDQYSSGGGYLPLVSNDLSSTNNLSIVNASDFSMGTTTKRHGSVLNITEEQYNNLLEKWPNIEPSRIQSYNYPDMYIRHTDFDVKLDSESDIDITEDSKFRLVPGIADNGEEYVSFQSVNYPGYYLRHFDFDFVLDIDDGSNMFKEDATFKQTEGLADSSYTSFQSYNYPTKYIRHYSYYLQLDTISTDTDKADATFKVIN